MRKLVIGLLCLSSAVASWASADDWYEVFEFDPRIGQLTNRYYENNLRSGISETYANLACWQAHIVEDNYPASKQKSFKPDTRKPAPQSRR